MTLTNTTNRTSSENFTTTLKKTVSTTITFSTTSTTSSTTTIDPAELLVERHPPSSFVNIQDKNRTIAVFLFQTHHHVLADVQLYLVRKFGVNLVAIDLFTDGIASKQMHMVANEHDAQLFSFPNEKHTPNAGPSDRHTELVNWAMSLRAKRHLGNGSAILLLDGDVFPLTPFDAATLLNSHDVVCRKHPAGFARFCWPGLIILHPRMYITIDDFSVSQTNRQGRAYDSGGKTVEYFLKYENSTFAWMQETIIVAPQKDLFFNAFNQDMEWIWQHFSRCDKCGPEIFYSPFNNSDAVFYHMISGASEWRFFFQGSRRQSLHKAVMNSHYGPNKTYQPSELLASVKRIKQLETIPYTGNLTCDRICRG